MFNKMKLEIFAILELQLMKDVLKNWNEDEGPRHRGAPGARAPLLWPQLQR